MCRSISIILKFENKGRGCGGGGGGWVGDIGEGERGLHKIEGHRNHLPTMLQLL